jgi:3-oxoacyl-[acyl-carrier-protein] synthase II
VPAREHMTNVTNNTVVISGVGPVTAIGIGRQAFAEGLARGRCGIGPVTGFDVEGLPCSMAAEAADLKVQDYLRSEKNYLDRNSELGFAACELALRDAGIALPFEKPERVGLCMGSEWGNVQTMAAFASKLREKGPRFVPPFIFPHTYPNTTASLLAIEYGAKGFHEVFAGSSISGAMAVVGAARVIRSGRADAMLVGGADGLSEEVYRGWAVSGMLSPSRGNGAEGCRPFGKDANGAVLGEAGAFLALEEQKHCAARGGRALAAIAGEAVAGDLVDAMRLALNYAGVVPSQISLVVASANGDPDADARELRALRTVLGEPLPRLLAVKAQVGECMGASGPLGLIAASVTLGAVRMTGCALVNCTDNHGNAVCTLVGEHA